MYGNGREARQEDTTNGGIEVMPSSSLFVCDLCIDMDRDRAYNTVSELENHIEMFHGFMVVPTLGDHDCN